MSWEKLQSGNVAFRILGRQLAEERLSHAYLFYGPGREDLEEVALAVAQAINCKEEDRPCGVCSSCRQILQHVHPDVRVIRPDEGSLKLEQIKEMVAQALVTPNVGPYRIHIIVDADTLTGPAANALLLTLEEPPGFTVFLLMARQPLLATVESRCQVLRLGEPIFTDSLTRGELYDYTERLIKEINELPLNQRPKVATRLAKAAGDGQLDLSLLIAELLRFYHQFIFWHVVEPSETPETRMALLPIYERIKERQVDLLQAGAALLYTEKRLQHNANKRVALEYLFYNL